MKSNHEKYLPAIFLRVLCFKISCHRPTEASEIETG